VLFLERMEKAMAVISAFRCVIEKSQKGELDVEKGRNGGNGSEKSGIS
jgi:hypothetical protein